MATKTKKYRVTVQPKPYTYTITAKNKEKAKNQVVYLFFAGQQGEISQIWAKELKE